MRTLAALAVSWISEEVARPLRYAVRRAEKVALSKELRSPPIENATMTNGVTTPPGVRGGGGDGEGV